MQEQDDEKHFLTEPQIKFYKKKMMNNIVNTILRETDAKLFGGAVRDMVAKDGTLPKDLDFYVSSRKDYDALIAFVSNRFNVTCFQKEKNEEYPFELSKARIPIFHNSVQSSPEKLCVLLDLVLVDTVMRNEDFDVNCLEMDQAEIKKCPSAYGYSLNQIVQHIKEKRAHLLRQADADILCIANRCWSLMQRGWTIVTDIGDFAMKESDFAMKENGQKTMEVLLNGSKSVLDLNSFQELLVMNINTPKRVEVIITKFHLV